MRHNESHSQQAIIRWFAFAHRVLCVPEIMLVSFPNGGKRGIIEAARLKREGARAGAPDLLLLVPRPPYHGMALELKTPIGRVSPEQKAFLGELIAQGYHVVIARSTEEAIQAITNYLRGSSGTVSIVPRTAPVSPRARPSIPPPSVLTREPSSQPERRVADVKPPCAL